MSSTMKSDIQTDRKRSTPVCFFHDEETVLSLAHACNRRDCKIFSTGEFGFIRGLCSTKCSFQWIIQKGNGP